MTSPAELFESTLAQAKKQAPPVGLAALSGKTPNRALQRAWGCLNDVGVTLARSNMNYRWRALYEADPKLAHAIEEVLVFGDALFSAWGKRESPESLKEQYIDLKQRFSKIIKETETLASPKEEKKLFSFFDKPISEDASKMNARLDHLDTLLDEAHDKSRALLQKTEQDLLAERAFHRAAEWYVLALEMAQNHLTNLLNKKKAIAIDVINDLRTALKVSSGTTTAILSTTDQWLRVKESLHNKSITFLTAHENTFTVIQGHLRSWKDIKNQTESLNALSKAVDAGAKLMNVASSGVEAPMRAWSPTFIAPEAIGALSRSFGEYDAQVSDLVVALSESNAGREPSVKMSRWDNWDATKKELLDPMLNEQVTSVTPQDTKLRPTLKKKTNPASPEASASDGLTPVYEAAPEPTPQPTPTVVAPLSAITRWSSLAQRRVQRQLKQYNEKMSTNWTLEHIQQKGWSVNEALLRLTAATRAQQWLDDKETQADIVLTSPRKRSAIDYEMASPSFAPWSSQFAKVLTTNVIQFGQEAWKEEFLAWLKNSDDLDWAYVMQWNELAYDLLILDQDPAQREAILQGATPDDEAIANSLKDRIKEFIKEPGLNDTTLRQWGFFGLVLRYGMALNVDAKQLNKLWRLWENPDQPIDWNGSPVASWSAAFPSCLATPAGRQVWKDQDMGAANQRPAITTAPTRLPSM